MKRSRDDVLFLVGVTVWVLLFVVTWPRALSFADEVGYVGRTKLLLAGHLGYVPGSPGTWEPSPHGGVVGKYPLLESLLLAPLVAIVPRASFLVAMVAALVLAWTARAILKSWGKSPLWALLMLGHPTVVILARTDMADLPQAAATLAAWWALRRGRALATVAWLALLIPLKPTGAVLALGVVGGEALSSLRALRARDPATWRRLAWGVVGGLGGLAVVLPLNFLGAGTLWFAYDHTGLLTPPFSPSFLAAHAPSYVLTLLLNPPLLVAGAWAYWKRRELAPLLLSGAYVALFCFYYFLDSGANGLESLVLAGRLILPAVAFLLIGWAAGLDDLLARLRAGGVAAAAPDAAGGVAPLPRLAAAVLFAIPLVASAGISVRHARYQRAMGSIRDLASAVADAHGERTLGVTWNAVKAGLLHEGPVILYDPARNRPAAVFCSEISASHRLDTGRTSCQLPGYHPVATAGGFFALARDDAGGDAR
jgi:hypothetical protein